MISKKSTSKHKNQYEKDENEDFSCNEKSLIMDVESESIMEKEIEMKKFKKKLVYYLNSNLPINLYGLQGSGKTTYMKNLMQEQISTKKMENPINAFIFYSSFFDFIYDEKGFFQRLFDKIATFHLFQHVSNDLRKKGYYDYNDYSDIRMQEIRSIVFSEVYENTRENLNNLKRKLSLFSNMLEIIIVIDDINNTQLFINNISIVNKLMDILHETGQGIVLISSFAIKSNLSKIFISSCLQNLYFPYHVPRDLIESEVLNLMRIAEDEDLKKENCNGNVNEDKKIGKKAEPMKKKNSIKHKLEKGEIITKFRERAIANLKQYMFNYNEYIYFFNNFSEFLSTMKLKDFKNHFKLYLTGSCFHFKDIKSKQGNDNNVKFDIFKDLLDFNKQEIIESLSYTQKVLIVSCFFGCVLSPERQVYLFGNDTDKFNLSMKKRNKKVKDESFCQSAIENKYVSFQSAVAIYYSLINKQKANGFLKLSYDPQRSLYLDFYSFDKHMDFIADITSLDKMKLIKILKSDSIAFTERTICIIADIELISEIGLSINIPLNEYV